jgi:hypothetical protein
METCLVEEYSWRIADSVTNPSLKSVDSVVNPLGDSKNLREVFTPYAALLGEPLTKNPRVTHPSPRF